MKLKRLALLLSVLFIFSVFLAACGDTATDSPPPEGPTDGGDDGQTWEKINVIGDIPEGAIDFADGNFGFVMMNHAPGDADPSELSIIDHNGGKALRVGIVDGAIPYLGIDVSSIYGGRVTDIRKIEVRVWAEYPPGVFVATGGTLDIYTGADNARTDFDWAIALERNNPRLAVAELPADRAFVTGANNIIVLRKGTRGGDAGAGPKANLIIDYIAAYDASGNVIPADSTAGFNAPDGFGAGDFSLLYPFATPTLISFYDNGASGSAGPWGQAGTVDMMIDDVPNDLVFDMLVPGVVINVGYEGVRAPELVFQSWTDGAPNGWAKVAAHQVNLSGNLAQFLIEDCIESFETDDFRGFLNRIHMGAQHDEITITSFAIAQRIDDGYVEFRPVRIGDNNAADITPFNMNSGSTQGGWGQAYRVDTIQGDEEGGDFDNAWLTPGGYLTLQYAVDGSSLPNVILHGGPWCQVSADLAVHDPKAGILQWSTDDLLARWAEEEGGDIMENLNILWIGDTGDPVTVYRLIVTWVE
jgi:hypothetical protein